MKVLYICIFQPDKKKVKNRKSNKIAYRERVESATLSKSACSSPSSLCMDYF